MDKRWLSGFKKVARALTISQAPVVHRGVTTREIREYRLKLSEIAGTVKLSKGRLGNILRKFCAKWMQCLLKFK